LDPHEREVRLEAEVIVESEPEEATDDGRAAEIEVRVFQIGESGAAADLVFLSLSLDEAGGHDALEQSHDDESGRAKRHAKTS